MSCIVALLLWCCMSPFKQLTGIGIHYLFTGNKCMECQVCISLLEHNLFHMNLLKCHQNKILEEIFNSKKYLEWCFKSGWIELAWGKKSDFHNASCFFRCFNKQQMIQELVAHLRKHLEFSNTVLFNTQK